MKLGLDFFQDIRIKKLRKMEHGDTLVSIYLKLLGIQAENDGFLEHKSKEIFVKIISESSTKRVRKHRKRKVLRSSPEEKNMQSCNSRVTVCNDSVTVV